jgi:hypothetical protein
VAQQVADLVAEQLIDTLLSTGDHVDPHRKIRGW